MKKLSSFTVLVSGGPLSLPFFFTFFFMTLTVTFFPFFQAISVPTASSSTSSSSAFMTYVFSRTSLSK